MRGEATLSELREPRVGRLTEGHQAAAERAVDIDRALSDLCDERLTKATGLAVVAVGGYGRGEISPHSDIDLLFIGSGSRSSDGLSKATLRNVLYPLWDAGFQVGHATVTPKQAAERLADDLHAATSLLTARLIWGSAELFEETLDRRDRWIGREKRVFARRILEATEERHRMADRVGWMLAPDIKDGLGGLRDVHAVGWLQAVTGVVEPAELRELGSVLLAVREALHGEVARKTDTLRLDLQQAVAERLGHPGEEGRDVLLETVHTTGRRIEYLSGISMMEARDAALAGPSRSGSTRPLAERIRLEDGRIRADGPFDADRSLEVIAAVSVTGAPLTKSTQQAIAGSFEDAAIEHWSGTSLDAFIRTLKGPHVVEALELLDHSGGWAVLIPEWRVVRGRAQHDPYHRYTVDAHSFHAVAALRTFCEEDDAAREAAVEVGDARSLYVGTLLHDIGKGSGEDHSVAGARMSRNICVRMGLSERETKEVETLVRHHLLLSDTATRRDIDDGAVISSVARTIGDARTLRMLYLLSGADGIATGAGAWSPWKGSLVALLFRRVAAALESGELPERNDVATKLKELSLYDPVVASAAGPILAALPPSYLASTSVEEVADDVRLLQQPPPPGSVTTRIDPSPSGEQTSVTVCFADRPGTLARTAGVLTLHRLSVLSAQAYTTEEGTALERFVVATPGPVNWRTIEEEMAAVYSGRLALDARLARKASDYRPKVPIEAEVRVLREESEHSTVVEIRAHDALGLLYALCSAISDLGFDIHVAKIDTLGERVVDTFYLRSTGGAKLDPTQEKELEIAIKHRVASMFGHA